MSVISNNPGPLAQDTAVIPSDERQIMMNVLMELRVISLYLRQGFNITDEDGALRNSLTLSDLNNLG